MDMFPVDILPGIAGLMGIEYCACAKYDLMRRLQCRFQFSAYYFYSIKIKGPIGFAKELMFQPFGPWLTPFNLFVKDC